ncbi:ABC transporter transmembrane domain-containing protein [Ignavigranum ruoffiae]|uniref:ABC transporter transmembrane domain-containing protein n=1 Tax=Ignavigranum ruoffiae TaxID=89093 RepID=UPI00235414C4|nr:ABC transporter transmembrane domain-containing protein [Ignavigranum ruoffiae]
MKDILSKDLSSFAQGNSSLYLSALTNDCERIEQNYLRTIFTLIQLSIMFIGSLSLMLYFSPILTLISLLVLYLANDFRHEDSDDISHNGKESF